MPELGNKDKGLNVSGCIIRRTHQITSIHLCEINCLLRCLLGVRVKIPIYVLIKLDDDAVAGE